MYEAVDARVPVLGFLFFDQPKNVDNLVDIGVVLSINN